MSQPPPRTFITSLAVLFQKGLRYRTVIDIGCADGHFVLQCMEYFPGATVLNIDANPIYEPSLKAIQEVIGGHYRITAITDAPGELEMTASAHPYWNSLLPSDDSYWEKINRLSAGKIKVPAVPLDTLAKSLNLAPPYLIKLDVQGAEVQALAGARQVLSETSVVICEADVDDFQSINSALVEAGLGLFDVSDLHFRPDDSLAWFYPVYLNRRHDDIKRRSFWDEAYNAQAVEAQERRRAAILKQSALTLDQLRTQRKRK